MQFERRTVASIGTARCATSDPTGMLSTYLGGRIYLRETALEVVAGGLMYLTLRALLAFAGSSRFFAANF